ncbi:MAG: AAA family ATPase, partial [Longimicrobiales bacterium]
PLAALCFLAVEPTAVRRSDLARLLWPSSTESRAKASIRQALWLIRKHTAPDIVVESDGSLEVDPEILATDLTAFESDLVSGRLADALARWSGGPLVGFAIPDAPAWLKWADGVRSRWEAHLGRALEDRASAATGSDRVEWLTRSIEVRPYRAEAWLALVEAHVELRDLDSAEAALTRLRSVSDPDDHELVAEAEARVRLLRRSAYEDPSDRLVPEFVGRSGEFAELMAAWRSARSGRPRVVGITGPAGIGKSALATETVRHCEADGAGVVEATAVRTEARLEYGVYASLVAELLRRPGAAGTSAASAQVLKSLVPSESTTASAGSPKATVLADAFGDLLSAVAHEAPLVILVDDAHWIDTASAIVLLRAVRSLRDSPVLMLWTCRAEGANNSGLAALTDAASSSNAVVLDLPALTRSEVAEMVGLMLSGGEPGAFHDLAHRLHRRSGGVPLHIVELLQDLRDRGVLGEDSRGRWRLVEGVAAALELPESLEEAQGDRIARLSPNARRIGVLLGQESGPLAIAALQRRSGFAVEECTQALSELFARDLVRWTRDDRVVLAHESLGSAFEEDSGSGSATAGPPSARTKWLSAAAGAAMLLAAGWALRGGAAEQADPAYGGGTLMVRSADSILMLRPGAEPGGLRRVGSRSIPDGLVVTTAVLHRSGDLWLGGHTVSDPVEPPAAVLWRGSTLDTLLAVPGDAGVRILRPQGDAAVLHVQNPDTSIYRAMVVRSDLTGDRDTTVLVAGAGHYGATHWSTDGRQILVRVDNSIDSVRVIDPSGKVIHQIEAPTPELLGAVPCGSGVLLWGTPPAQTVRTWIWVPGEGVSRPIDLGAPQFPTAVCSPDGSTVALIESDGVEEHLVVRDTTGAVLDRVELTGGGFHWVEWLAPLEPAPASVVISGPDLELERGARWQIEARVLDVDRREVDAPLTWVSDDPAVASIRPDGTVVANRPGRTTVTASVDGWLTDAIGITVLPGDSTTALAFVDSFPDLDTTRWVNSADSTPVPVRVEGRTALRLNGDGRYRDAIDSFEDFDLSRGGTVEILFRLREFNRRDRQRVQLCLEDAPGAGGAPARFACLTWPAAEGFDFDPDAIRFQVSGGILGKIPLGGGLMPGEWNTLAIQVRADGRVSAVANDSIVAVHPALLRMEPDARFHIAVAHSAVDTELHLREVSVWTEERYR